MTREQVEHALRAVADITGQSDFVVIGSQSIHGQYPDPPVRALTMSNEVDLHGANYDEAVAVEIDLLFSKYAALREKDLRRSSSIGVDRAACENWANQRQNSGSAR